MYWRWPKTFNITFLLVLLLILGYRGCWLYRLWHWSQILKIGVVCFTIIFLFISCYIFMSSHYFFFDIWLHLLRTECGIVWFFSNCSYMRMINFAVIFILYWGLLFMGNPTLTSKRPWYIFLCSCLTIFKCFRNLDFFILIISFTVNLLHI